MVKTSQCREFLKFLKKNLIRLLAAPLPVFLPLPPCDAPRFFAEDEDEENLAGGGKFSESDSINIIKHNVT